MWVLDLRGKGYSPKAIGMEINLSAQRIRQLEKEGKKRLAQIEKAKLPCNADDICRLDLGTRASNCLRNANIRTISELTNTESDKLLRTRNVGVGVLREIKSKLERFSGKKVHVFTFLGRD